MQPERAVFTQLDADIWLETFASLAVTIAINCLVLAPLAWLCISNADRARTRVARAVLACVCIVVLSLPFVLMTVTKQLHALPSACGAFMCYVGVWKVIDVVGGTANFWVRSDLTTLVIHMSKSRPGMSL